MNRDCNISHIASDVYHKSWIRLSVWSDELFRLSTALIGSAWVGAEYHLGPIYLFHQKYLLVFLIASQDHRKQIHCWRQTARQPTESRSTAGDKQPDNQPKAGPLLETNSQTTHRKQMMPFSESPHVRSALIRPAIGEQVFVATKCRA